jgi:hypothetical protein
MMWPSILTISASAQALLGFTALQQGNHDTASRLLDESLHIYQANGQLTGVAQVRHHQAALAMKTGNPACAEALFDDVVAIASQTQDTGLATYALLSSIPILVDDGRITDARRAVALTEIALGLLSATGWQDDELLAWFWRTVAPAYEELDEAALAGAREQAQRMLPGAALSYAAGDDD